MTWLISRLYTHLVKGAEPQRKLTTQPHSDFWGVCWGAAHGRRRRSQDPAAQTTKGTRPGLQCHVAENGGARDGETSSCPTRPWASVHPVPPALALWTPGQTAFLSDSNVPSFDAGPSSALFPRPGTRFRNSLQRSLLLSAQASLLRGPFPRLPEQRHLLSYMSS